MSHTASEFASFEARVVAPHALTPSDEAAWNALRAAHPDYDTPLLSPAFAKTVGAGRTDARVALLSDTAGLVAVLAFHQRPDGLGRPLGAPFCDYAGPVVRRDCALSLSQIIALAGLGGYRTQAMLDPWNRFEGERTGGTSSRLVRLENSPADYLEARRAEYPKRFKNFRRLESLMRREGHAPVLKWGHLDAALRDQLYAYKSVQYRASGLVDLTTAARARAVLDSVEQSPAGFQASLWTGDTLVSADFGFREGAAFHPWIAAYNPDFAAYSPGNIFQKQVIENLAAMGLSSYDLAEGHDHYKKYFTNSGRTLYSVDITASGARGWWLTAQRKAWDAAGARREGSPASRLKRRSDHGAACYARTHEKLADLVTALHKRGVSATPVSGHAADAD